ncbi:S9 family peptidase [Massilia endophytica]|uniref:S9 family peptidase n=1 Tax=Massilia endophytica TaxID=2899220 RepID=UPI001E477D04|nr:prolyl oligopeptidase family serine peptidase [Massilia endophytica]UGQ48832.1 prolyl oligopeptidase family serine peptidase [Massilia endophytica]
MKTMTLLLQAGRARAFVLPLLLLALPASHAAAPAPTDLKAIAARNAALPATPPLTTGDLMRRSALREVKISPDGSLVAYLTMEGRDISLDLYDTSTRQSRRLVPNTGRAELGWSTDGTALFLDTPAGLSVVDIADGSSRKVMAFDSALTQRMVAVDATHPRHVIAEEWDRKASRYQLFRLAADGTRETLHEDKRPLREFLLGPDGKPAFIKTWDEQYTQIVSHRRGGEWKEVTRCKRLRSCRLISATPDGSKLAMMVNENEDRKALAEVDTASRRQRILHTDPLAISDLRNVILDRSTGQPLLATYELPLRRHAGLTPEAQRAAAAIAQRFGDAAIAIDPSKGAWLLAEGGSRLPQERFWLYQPASGSFEEILGAEREGNKPLPEAQLAAKHPVSYRASDGQTIHGYLTLPPGRAAAGLPLMTLVHGGPWGRFEGDYMSLVQLIANRGVAVFQPNFRASTGYGDKFMLAPKADFGNGRVQRDIIEGVEWLLANGIGDRSKLGIMGDSFGGYSVLLALTHTPTMFQFGMATVAPPEFSATLALAAAGGEDADSEVPYAIRFKEMGIAYDDPAAMRRIAEEAPAAHPERVQRPLVMLAGGKDKKVELKTITAYAEKLHSLGKPVTLLVDPDEGHNPRKPMTRDAYVYLLEQQLHKYFGTAAPSEPSEALRGYLKQNTRLP